MKPGLASGPEMVAQGVTRVAQSLASFPVFATNQVPVVALAVPGGRLGNWNNRARTRSRHRPRVMREPTKLRNKEEAGIQAKYTLGCLRTGEVGKLNLARAFHTPLQGNIPESSLGITCHILPDKPVSGKIQSKLLQHFACQSRPAGY